eukprot:NODE_704_length_4578_cov_0.780978.p6 type:complete len:127 gc:universal NODE_704_length_4578_cov_0.780978:2695-2315(-)
MILTVLASASVSTIELQCNLVIGASASKNTTYSFVEASSYSQIFEGYTVTNTSQAIFKDPLEAFGNMTFKLDEHGLNETHFIEREAKTTTIPFNETSKSIDPFHIEVDLSNSNISSFVNVSCDTTQ